MHMWASHSAHIYNLLPHDWASPLTGWTPYLWVELSLFAYIFGRVVEETQQVYLDRSSYFKDRWNQIDLLTVIFMLCCFVMRVVVWVDGLNASTEMAPGAVMSTYIGDGTLRLEPHVKEILMQLQLLV